MKIRFIAIGKTPKGFMKESLESYLGRLNHYLPVEFTEITIKGVTAIGNHAVVMKEEAFRLEALLKPGDHLVLLHEEGKEYTSVGFSQWLEKQFNQTRPLVFVAGGAFGFDATIRKRAAAMLSLSKMTFTHQMVRIVFLEQLYRAMKIMRNEEYHY